MKMTLCLFDLLIEGGVPIVDDHVIVFNFGIILGHLGANGEEESISQLHDVLKTKEILQSRSQHPDIKLNLQPCEPE